MIAIGVGLLILLGSFGAGAQANAAFMPAFNKNVRTMCDNSWVLPNQLVIIMADNFGIFVGGGAFGGSHSVVWAYPTSPYWQWAPCCWPAWLAMY